MPETRSLHRKLAQVMYEAARIPKTGTAPAAMGGFAFVEAGVVADVIRKALADHVITMIPTTIELVDSTEHETSSKKMMTTLTVRTTWTLTDGESGETIQIQSLGSGADMGDKAAPKAQTSAMKYALLMGFMLSTGDDPERTDTSDRQAAPSPNRPAPARLAPRDGSLIGIAEVAAAPHDWELREQPDGEMALGFKLTGLNGDGSKAPGNFRVIASGELAELLYPFREHVIDKRVTAFGTMSLEEWPAKGTKGEPGYKPAIPYTRLILSRIEGPDGLVVPSDAPTLPLGLLPEQEAELDQVALAL